MKIRCFSRPTLVVLFIAGAAALAFAAERGLPQNPLIKEPGTWPVSEDKAIGMYLAQNRDKMVRVTKKPNYVTDWTRSMCAPGFELPHQLHADFWIHVFINPEAAELIKSGKGVYPEGTIILKQKFLDAEAKQTEFYTGMRKREKGYNPALGDWEFFTLDKTGTKVTARGRIDSCMDCHANFKETDFVSRNYLREPASKPTATE